METLQAIAKRKSTRNFNPDKQIPKAALDTILSAGCAAPIGAGDYKSLHVTVIQNSAVLDVINKTAQEAFKANRNFLYNAPILVVISASAEQKGPNIEFANAACVIENMLLAATDAGLSSCYIWGVIAGLAGNRELYAKLGIPDGYTPVSGAAFGYSKEGDTDGKDLSISLSINYI